MLWLCLGTPFPALACGTWWWDFGGKGDHTCLQITEAHPLEHYVGQQATWQPGSPPSALHWQALALAPRVQPIGRLGAGRLVHVAYDAGHHLFAWEHTQGAFRPVLLIDGTPDIIARVLAPEAFGWQGQTIVHVRLLVSSSAGLQESVFLLARGDAVVSLPVDHQPLHAQLRAQGLKLGPRHNVFCSRTLVFAGGLEDSHDQPAGSFRADYAPEGEVVSVASLRLYRDSDPPETEPCASPR